MNNGYSIDDLFDTSSPYYHGGLDLSNPPGAVNAFTDSVSPSQLDSGELQGNTTVVDGYLKSQNYVAGVSGWYLDALTGEFNFAVSVDSLDIPDTTTASSFHVDINGNTWWGANVASGYANAPARVLASGDAVFKSIQIGGTTRQFQASDSGVFNFGDGSDGSATCDGSTAVAGMTLGGSTYTMTRDVYFVDLTINTSIILEPSGYRIFVLGTLTMNGTIQRNGNAGGVGGNGDTIISTGGTAGAALADGYLKGSLAGQAGANGPTANQNNGNNGVATTNSIGSSGVAGGTGGTNEVGVGGGTGGTGGTATPSNVRLIANWHLATLLDVSSSGATVKFDNSASSGSGGSGRADSSRSGGAGGGSGSAGGIVAIYARAIVIGAAGIIQALGGAGGAGGIGWPVAGDTTGGGGGGGGGNGGQIILVYNTLTNSGSISVTGGAGGAGGTATAPAGAGGDGTAGATGTIYQFQVSL